MNTTSTLPEPLIAPGEDFQKPPKLILPESRDNSAVLRLLDEWIADESGYDERVWPIVKGLIEENRLPDRALEEIAL